eukprot:CAMPEP_0181051238 /NCGR_PEP_ID=MMETSP1070-20121207/16945_1 /TAXON_ID=265543 /ORGANISM="Minutocellus polymorphus, Strain NH13" /LENGTH=298 /DNA_ID=CAMNT_0023130241 /DNA_START=109 /DNA_END=1005 /DNA_ORIENTATION=+
MIRTTLLDDDGLIPQSDINSDEGGVWANVGRFWIISVAIFAAGAFILVAFCKRYGAALVDGWVNDRAHGELSEENYLQRVMRRRAEREEAMKECPVKRKVRLVERLDEEGVAMTVAESDLVRSVDDACSEGRGTLDKNNDDVDIECGCANEDGEECEEHERDTSEANDGSSVFHLGDDEAAFVRLPPSPPAPNGSRLVPNCCAVCLCPYEVGETLVWSSNTSCRHAFHRDCVVEYLCKVQEVDCPCPCCRGTFVNLPHHLDEENGKNRKRLMSDVTRTSSFDTDETQLAFNTNRISLR